jgi:quercetin dioxygenase-like cupin family protein
LISWKKVSTIFRRDLIYTGERGLLGYGRSFTPPLIKLFSKPVNSYIIVKRDVKMSEELKSVVINVEELLDYQEGAVVSREIIRKETGTVTIFAFDKGEGLSEHTAPFDAMVQIIDGKAEITISGEKNTLQRGDMIIMPANEPHALHALERYKMILTMIRS